MSILLPIELVIFDCDGVLVDSEPLANRLLMKALQAEGLDVTLEETVRLFVGRTMDYVVEVAEERLGCPLPENFLERLQDQTFDAFRADLKPMPGAIETVRSVQSLGLKTCVASNGSIEKMGVSLGVTRLIDLFDGHIFSRQLVPNGKPAPDLFLFAASEMNVATGQCLVIEDSATGVTAAMAAGMRVVRFTPDCAEGSVATIGRLMDVMRLLELK